MSNSDEDRTESGERLASAGQRGTTAVDPGQRVLVVFATRHGSTAAVAEAIAEELRAAGLRTDVAPAASAGRPTDYDAVVVGGPMIMGWHKDALRYIARHRDALAARPTAYFITAMSLTETGVDRVDGVPIVTDPWLVKKPKDPARLNRRERYARPAHYLEKPFRQGPRVRPRSVAFFGGSLDLTTMNIFEKLFVMLVIGATPGDTRHWEAIRAWAKDLPALLTGEPV